MPSQLPRRYGLKGVLAAVVLLVCAGPASSQLAQLHHWSGQGVAPVYEGFDINPDGTYNLWFGYMNRNFEEEIDIPLGADNKMEPVGPDNKIGTVGDRGQPTHFAIRRHKDIFNVVVPRDFGVTTKMVWSLTVRGRTEAVAATLNRVWQIDRQRTTREGDAANVDSNTPPVVNARTPTPAIPRGGVATLNVSATDDGRPIRRGKPIGMTVEWAKYRGPGKVTLSPPKQPLVEGKAVTTASFSEPGEYVLLAVVDDGSGESAGNFGYHCCWTDAQVKVTVK
jgi:hypothetical protein